jgi:hypothetical protein
MIIWLASYPKSGNTWVRGFLISLLYTAKGTSNLKDFPRINQYPIKSQFGTLVDDFKNITKVKKFYHKTQDILNLNKKIKILKTHNALVNLDGDNFSSTKNTLGVIHIVRDPRNVITSLKHYYSIPNYQKAKEFLFDEKRVIYGDISKKEFPIATMLTSWKTHYLSWKQVQNNYLLIKYENLINKPDHEFRKISNFFSKLLNKKFSETKIQNSIESNKFDNLKEQETREGFGEFINNENKQFFNLGPANDWKKFLDKNTKDEIESRFYGEMKELKYLL